MKHKLQLIQILILSLFFLFSLSAKAQLVQVKSQEQIKEIKLGFNALFTPSGRQLLFTSQSQQGLFVFDFDTKKTKTLNMENGAGFQPVLSANGKEVFYKSYEFDAQGKRQSSIVWQSIETEQKKAVIERQRSLSSPTATESGAAFLVNSQALNYNSKAQNIKGCTETVCFASPDLDLVVVQNQAVKVLNPFGKGNYIWVSLSPKGDKILFNKAGKGSYICDLNGTIVQELGRINAPKWSADGTLIIGMNEQDDGQKYTSSKIVIAEVAGTSKQELNLKETDIALFPSFSQDNSKIVFNDEKGNIFIVNLIQN